jgi:hypothetical protein
MSKDFKDLLFNLFALVSAGFSLSRLGPSFFNLKIPGDMRRSRDGFSSGISFLGTRLEVDTLSKRFKRLLGISSRTPKPDKLGLEANCDLGISD